MNDTTNIDNSLNWYDSENMIKQNTSSNSPTDLQPTETSLHGEQNSTNSSEPLNDSWLKKHQKSWESLIKLWLNYWFNSINNNCFSYSNFYYVFSYFNFKYY